MSTQLLAIKTRFTDDTGAPLKGGQVYTFYAGTSTPKETYKDVDLLIPNTNPVILDDTGAADIYLKGSYRIRVLDRFGALIEEQDDVSKIISRVDAGELVGSLVSAITNLSDTKSEIEKVKLDTGITVTPQGVGMVARTQAQVNAETVSLLRFGAPYSTDSTTHLQKAIDYLDSIGGGTLTLPYHTGRLVLNGSINMRENITVICAENLIIDCTVNTSFAQIFMAGSVDPIINLAANRTTGDSTFTTTAPHEFKAGDDILLVSQRECAHVDAGINWRLGETTANTASPVFAEPLVVKSVESPTTFTSVSALIFPDYRIDKTKETSLTARDRSVIFKINAIKNSKWIGGIFRKETGGVFRTTWGKDCVIQAKFERGRGIGQEVYNVNSINSVINADVVRPVDWVKESDHSNYNSIKDVSSWHTKAKLFERNGCQGLDQTFTNYTGIQPEYEVTHVNSREDAMTTHGCVYGCKVNITAVGCNAAAFRNRARFATGTVTALACKTGMYNSGYGVVDSDIKVDIRSAWFAGVTYKSAGVTTNTPVLKNSKLSGRIIMSEGAANSALSVEDNINDDKIGDSGLVFSDLYIRSYAGKAVFLGDSINGADLSKVKVDHYGTTSAIWFRRNTGHNLSNIDITMHNTINNVPAILASGLSASRAAEYGNATLNIDYASCKVKGGGLLSADSTLTSTTYTSSGSDASNASTNIGHKNVSKMVTVNITSGNAGQNRIVLGIDLPINLEVTIVVNAPASTKTFGVYTSLPQTLRFLDGVNDAGNQFLNITETRQFKFRKVSETEILVYR